MITFVVHNVMETLKYGLSHVDSEDTIVHTCVNTFGRPGIVGSRQLLINTPGAG